MEYRKAERVTPMQQHITLLVYQFSLDSAIAEWIAQKKTTGSQRTAIEYTRTMESETSPQVPGSPDLLMKNRCSEEK